MLFLKIRIYTSATFLVHNRYGSSQYCGSREYNWGCPPLVYSVHHWQKFSACSDPLCPSSMYSLRVENWSLSPEENSPGVAAIDDPDPVEHDEDHEGGGAACDLVARLHWFLSTTASRSICGCFGSVSGQIKIANSDAIYFKLKREKRRFSRDPFAASDKNKFRWIKKCCLSLFIHVDMKTRAWKKFIF